MAYTDIDKPSDYFNTVLYAGTGSENTISGVGFQPNWTWLKSRTNTQPHVVSDSVRGATKQLYTADTQTETSYSQYVKSFNSDGFVLGTDNQINQNSQNFVSWNWKETATAGFDIVSYTGNGSARTISHSLSAIPKMIIIKNRDDTDSWRVYHASTGNGGSLMLNLTNAFASDSTMWNNTSPTSSVFSLGDHDNVNGNGHKFIAYCFAEKKGYSKFGSYTGNGSTDGSFIYCGFKPAFIINKKSSSTSHWLMYDNKRKIFNPNDEVLYSNLNNSEDTNSGLQIDRLANGYKLRGSNSDTNASGDTYIFMAFAENPFVTSTGVPATAR